MSIFEKLLSISDKTHIDIFGTQAFLEVEDEYTFELNCIFEYTQEFIDSQSEQVIIANSPAIWFRNSDLGDYNFRQGTRLRINQDYFRVKEVLKDSNQSCQASLFKIQAPESAQP